MGLVDDVPPPTSSSSSRNGFFQALKENSGKKSIFRSRRQRGGFSDSFSTHDLESLDIEDAVTGEPSASLAHEGTSATLQSETASSNVSTSASEDESSETSAAAAHWRGFFHLLKKGPQERLKGLHPRLSVPRLTRRKSKRIREEMVPDHSPSLKSSFDGEFCCFKSSWKNFSLADLLDATNNFSQGNLIGEGGYAEVYKGELKDGQHVAIKRLTRGSQEEMISDFLSELGVIVHVDHPNIAKLIGYGVEGGMHLVLQLSPHGSLSSILYGPRERLDWKLRYNIALGTAKGLQYLHEGGQRRIIHRDIKAANILLSQEFEPQISDFGLSKWLPDQWTHHVVSNLEGTFGYLPPELFMHGIVDEKTDVYAYGVLLLELLTGKPALDSSQRSLVMWAKPLLDKNSMEELIDPCLSTVYDEAELNRIALIASSCISPTSAQRPPMSEVVKILKAEGAHLDLIRNQQKCKLQRTYSEELLDADDYNSTKFLNELQQQTDSVLSHCNSIKPVKSDTTEACGSSTHMEIRN